MVKLTRALIKFHGPAVSAGSTDFVRELSKDKFAELGVYCESVHLRGGQTEQDRRDFKRRMGQLVGETGTPVYAWALMDNHGHVLLSSGSLGLEKFMPRLLTGYAVIYNLRHPRHGHVFQNRYKSIVSDGDSYFTELVRYIHLNPVRVQLVRV